MHFCDDSSSGGEECVDAFSSDSSGERPEQQTSCKTKTVRCGMKIIRSGLEIASAECCANKCLQQFSIERLNELESEIKKKSEAGKKDFLTSLLTKQIKWSSDEADLLPEHCIDIFKICSRAFMVIYDISDYYYNMLIQNVKDKGHYRNLHGNTGQLKMRKGASVAYGALRVFLDENAQHLPNFPHKIVTTFQSKKHIYEYIKNSTELTGQVVNFITYERFVQIWKQNFYDFKVKKMQGVVYCATCTQLFDKIRKSKTSEEFKYNSELKALHMGQVKKSYDYFNLIVQQAQVEKYEQDCILIDGMDQRKTDLPRFCQEDKDTASCLKLRTHITGAIVYTNVETGEMPFLFYDLCQFPHDMNIVANVLLNCLIAKHGRPRSKLHLKLDNTARENKNKFMMAFCSALISTELYDEVVLMFHPVGHTHSRVDALFSRVFVALSSTDIGTLSEFHERIKEAQGEASGRPFVKELWEIFDIKGWMGPFMEHEVEGLMNKHFFFFYKKDGIVRMRYKNYCGDNQWFPVPADEADDLRDGYQMLRATPDLDIIPDFITPSFTLKSTGTVLLDAVVLKRQLTSKCIHRLSTDQMTEWINFLENSVLKRLEVPDKPNIWPLTMLLSSKNFVHQADDQSQTDANELEIIRTETNEKILKKLCGGVQLVVGNQGRIKPDKVPDGVAAQEIATGMLLAVRPDITNQDLASPRQNFKQTPWICQAKSPVNEDGTIEVQWLVGKLSGTWNMEKRGNKKSKRTFVEDKIHVNAVYLWGFKLLQSKHLEKTAINTIEKEMASLQNEYDRLYPNESLYLSDDNDEEF